MTTHSKNALNIIDLYTKDKSFEDVLKGIKQQEPGTLPPIPELDPVTAHTTNRLTYLEEFSGINLQHLPVNQHEAGASYYKGNIENFIGLTKIPTGVVGPLYINGTLAKGDYMIPLATTEAALVASYHRGAKATRLSGGITSVCTTEGLQRTPVWKFDSLVEVGQFIHWLLQQMDKLKEIVKEHSRFAVLEDLKLNMEGNHVLTLFEYTCGEAAGQNMITICTEGICNYIEAYSPVKPLSWYIESNYSGDKKATAVAFSSVRGKKVNAEAVILKEVVADVLRSNPHAIADYWQTSVVSALQSGSIGMQGHVANGLSALFLATGQDVACVAEACVGITRMEVTGKGDLYVSITLPSLVVGTVGGGTGLPTQQECLHLLQCTGKHSARKFAEICGALALAGELSIAAAIASGQFGKAHKLFRRKSK